MILHQNSPIDLPRFVAVCTYFFCSLHGKQTFDRRLNKGISVKSLLAIVAVFIYMVLSLRTALADRTIWAGKSALGSSALKDNEMREQGKYVLNKLQDAAIIWSISGCVTRKSCLDWCSDTFRLILRQKRLRKVLVMYEWIWHRPDFSCQTHPPGPH